MPEEKQISNQFPAWIRDSLVEASKYPDQRSRLAAINKAQTDAQRRYPHLFQAHA